MKKKHVIKKLIKSYEHLDNLVYQFLTTTLTEEEFEAKYWELNGKFEKVKDKCATEKPKEVKQPMQTVRETSLDAIQDKTIIHYYNDIRNALKEQVVKQALSELALEELEVKLALSEYALKETVGLTEHPVVASDNPDLWYSDPKPQHNLGGGYPTWAQGKDQAKAMTEHKTNLGLKDIPRFQDILDALNKDD